MKKDSKPWGNFWKEKRHNNNEFLIAAENGDVETMKQMLDPTLKMACVADINISQDGFSALHFAASEGRANIIKDLIGRKGIVLEPLNNM